jgi:hypothetical protein
VCITRIVPQLWYTNTRASFRIKNFDQKALPSLNGAAEADDSPAEEAETALQNDSNIFKPTKVNPVFLMFYGHIMACGKSYQSAIGKVLYIIVFTNSSNDSLTTVYYLRAYDMRPDDPLVCLTLALSYVHRAMQRQTDNRHYQLTQVRWRILLLKAANHVNPRRLHCLINIASIAETRKKCSTTLGVYFIN